MASMIKYELKKIFQSKLCIVFLILALIGMIAYTANSLNSYRTGQRGHNYPLSDMQKKRVPETFVSNKNIGELRAKLEAFEANDEIYIVNDSREGGTVFQGKYDIDMSALINRVENGEMTEAELDEYLETHTTEFVIKKEYLPEYFGLYMPVNEYDNKVNMLASERRRIKSYDPNGADYQINLAYLNDSERKLAEGFTVGYDYGWANIFESLPEGTSILLAAAIIFGLCGVFTGEYAASTDALLLSSRRGRARLVTAKITASMLYTAIIWAAYMAMTVTVSFAFLGTEGAHVGTASQDNLQHLFSVCHTTLLGAALLTLSTLLVSALLTKPIPSAAGCLAAALWPIGAEIVLPGGLNTPLIEAMPLNILFGTHLYNTRHVFYGGGVHNLRELFLPVAVVTVIICVPLVYTFYCRHQVKN